MTNQRRREKRPHVRGEAMCQKVTLHSVLLVKSKGACKRNCLREIEEKHILNQRYMAWGQKYELRSTWILQMLSAFFRRTEGGKRHKYETKLDGFDVCNAYYAATLGYFQRRFKKLKQSQQVYGRLAVVHGNTCHLSKEQKCLQHKPVSKNL